MPTAQDLAHLRMAIRLAEEALLAGDSPFGSVLVDAETNQTIKADRNRIVTGEVATAAGDTLSQGKPDATLHPELTLARWAQRNLGAVERARTVMYTSGEHCAMCAAAHAYCGLGKVVYAASGKQYAAWMEEYGVSGGAKVKALAINDVAPGIEVEGPVAGLDEEVKALHVRRWTGQG